MSLRIDANNVGKVHKIGQRDNTIRAYVNTIKKRPDGSFDQMCWPAIFIGAGREKAAKLSEGDLIKLCDARIENKYIKETRTFQNTLLISDYEVKEKEQ